MNTSKSRRKRAHTGLALALLVVSASFTQAAQLQPLEQQAQQGTEAKPVADAPAKPTAAQQNQSLAGQTGKQAPGKRDTRSLSGSAASGKNNSSQNTRPTNNTGPAATSKPAPRPAPAKARPVTNQQGEMLFNFQDADIKAVIKTISQITGKNFVLDPRVKGKVSIISAKPVSKPAAYRIFLSALKAQGFTVADVDRHTVKIVPVGEGKHNANIYRGGYQGETLVSQVVVVQHGTATEMVPLLRPLMSPTSQLSAYGPANALIITDYADNVSRLLQLVDDIDKPVSTDVTIVPLKHASAVDIADMLDHLLEQQGAPGAKGAPGGGAGRTSIVPDLRTNSLLLRSDNPGHVAQVRKLIDKLDVPAKTEGNTRVIYLRNAEATKLAEILRGLMEAATRSSAAKTSRPGKPGTPSAAAASGPTTSLVQADEATNSLIINASDAVYNNLRGVIEKLDARRAQVFVEALIVEITSDHATQFGFQWAGAGSAGQGGVGGVTNFPLSGVPITAAAIDPLAAVGAAGLSLAYLGPDITLPDGRIVRGLGGLARALEDDNAGNILSTPAILTLDNAEAKIVVGQNVPFLTGSFTNTGGTGGAVNPFQTIERKDVGLTLKIKPQITEGGTIKLEIASEVSSVARAASVSTQDVVTNKRTLETTVVVEDRSTIALGGLIEDTADETEQGVPLLSRIPILGWLFKFQENRKRKTNLMVFLRPTIVRSAEESTRYTQDRYEYIVRQQDKTGLMSRDTNGIDKFNPANNPVPPAEKADEAAGKGNGSNPGQQPDKDSATNPSGEAGTDTPQATTNETDETGQ